MTLCAFVGVAIIMVVEKGDIIESFIEIGLDVKNDVLDKCIELCSIYQIEPDELVETWMAYTISNSVDAVPDVDHMSQMEKKILSKRKPVKQSSIATPTEVKVYTAGGNEQPTDEFLDVYSSGRENGINQKTPKSNSIAHRSVVLHTPRVLFSPASFSPKSIAESQKYTERTNAGSVVCNFGNDVNSATWQSSTSHSVTIKSIEEFQLLGENTRYMYDTLLDRLRVLYEHVECMSREILKENSLENNNYTLVEQTLEPVSYAGRICCDTDGRLNASSLLLESSDLGLEGQNVSIDVSNITDYSLFPGQVIALEGKNPNGNMIFVEKIYTDVRLRQPSEPTASFKLTEPLQVVIAAGPFTPSETFSYQPIEDLLQYVLTYNPHVLVIIGPIVDALHPNIADCKLAETFTQCFDRVLEGLVKPLSKTHTKVIVVSSWREAGHHVIYPTPPSQTILKKQYPNLHILPDPSIINIEGINFGFTASDILMHLGREEIFKSSSGSTMDRFSRLSSHIIQQRSFYPLLPPDKEMSMDFDLWWDYAQMPIIPHILVLPSDFRFFIKFVHGCLTINPARLTKGEVGGSFARIEIRPPAENEKWSSESHINVQIVKI